MPGKATKTVVIGTRGSALAVWQAEWVRARLVEQHPGLDVTLQRIKTSGDKMLDVSLAKIGGKGLFVKEIEDALLAGEIDVAVHSLKDVPTVLPEALEIVCVPAREDPRDALVSRGGRRFDALPAGARIGTSSLRRQAQLLHRRADLRIELLRGNVETRLRKLREGAYDAIVLAAAGLQRLGWSDQVTEYLSFDVCLPAIGQGALGLEGRRDDAFIKELVSGLEDSQTRISVSAERALLDRLQGGCQVPIAAHATGQDGDLQLEGLVASLDGRRIVRDRVQGSAADARRLGVQLAERLLAQGGGTILKEIYGEA